MIVLAHYFPEMAEAVTRFPSDEWVRVAREAGVPLQPVRTPEEALADQALIAEGASPTSNIPSTGRCVRSASCTGCTRRPGGCRARHRARGSTPMRCAPRPTPSAVPVASTAPLRGTERPAQPAPCSPLRSKASPCSTSGSRSRDRSARRCSPTSAPTSSRSTRCATRGGTPTTSRTAPTAASAASASISRPPEGLAVLHRLVEQADVVHSNMRAAAVRLQVDEASLRAVNPDIIYCHTRGFDRGPRSDSPGNDQTGCSLAGVTYEDGGVADGGDPFWSLTSLGDTGNGFLSAIGVIQALYHRRRTGSRRRSTRRSSTPGCCRVDGCGPRRRQRRCPERPHLDRMQLGLIRCTGSTRPRTDGCASPPSPTTHWRSLLGALDRRGPPTIASPRMRPAPRTPTRSTRARRRGARGTSRRATCSSGSTRTACRARSPIPSSPPACSTTPRCAPAGSWSAQHPELGRFEHFGTTIDFSDTPGRIWGPPPLVGQHTREIMHEYGFDDTEIDALCSDKAIFETMSVND